MINQLHSLKTNRFSKKNIKKKKVAEQSNLTNYDFGGFERIY